MLACAHTLYRAMNAALQAYARTALTGLSGRALEAAVLARCATDLQRAAEGLPDTHFELIEALERNRKVWRLFAAEARDPDTHLPADVRGNLIVTASFVFARTADVCELRDTERLAVMVSPLVEYNRHLVAGLEGRAA